MNNSTWVNLAGQLQVGQHLDRIKFGIIYLLTKNTKYCHKTKTRLQILGNLVFEFNMGYVFHPMNGRSFSPLEGTNT